MRHRHSHVLNFACFWMLQIPVGYYRALHRHMGPSSVYKMVVLADSLLALPGILWFRRGTWKHQKV